METIIYQGTEVQATLVNYLSGTIPTSTVDHDGDEELFRDEAGRYYLRRTLNLLDSESDDPQPASGRTHVHRINVNAAILWATTRLNSETLDLRNDAAALLTEGRAYREPAPTLPMRRVAALVDSVNDKNHHGESQYNAYGVSPETLAAAHRYAATAGRTLEQMVAEFLETTAENMASGDGIVQQVAPPEPPLDEQIIGDRHRFTFDYPATARTCGRQITVELDEAQMRRAGELAAVFDLDPAPFLRGLADYNDLPGQPRRGHKLHNSLQASHVAFVCMDEAMAKRIERAALTQEQTVDEFVAHAISGDVDMWEEAMLLHPVSGEVLEACYENLYTEADNVLTTPPLDCVDAPPFHRQPVGMRLRLDARASALIRRYQEVTPWDYTAEDIVSGAVINALDIAFHELAETSNHLAASRGRDFADDGWGYVEEEIYDARQRRNGEPELHEQEDDGTPALRTPKAGHGYPDNPAAAVLLEAGAKEAA